MMPTINQETMEKCVEVLESNMSSTLKVETIARFVFADLNLKENGEVTKVAYPNCPPQNIPSVNPWIPYFYTYPNKLDTEITCTTTPNAEKPLTTETMYCKSNCQNDKKHCKKEKDYQSPVSLNERVSGGICF